MSPSSTTSRLKCVVSTQIIFVTSLISMGLLLVIGSVSTVGNLYWKCPVVNAYYTISWLCLAMGVMQIFLSVAIAVLLYVQPRSAQIDNLVLIGPEGHRLGEISKDSDHIASSPWTLWISPNNENLQNQRRCYCPLCCCYNEWKYLAPFQVTFWIRPAAIFFFLIVIAHLATISLTASFISRARNQESDLTTEVTNIFIEAKPYFLHASLSILSSAAAKCWDPLEFRLRCCGSLGPETWLMDHSINGTYHGELLVTLQRRCSCPRLEHGICETRNFQVAQNLTVTEKVYIRGCSSIVYEDILRDLHVFRVVIPVSLCVILLACLGCIIVTLRVANVEMGDTGLTGDKNGVNGSTSETHAKHTVPIRPHATKTTPKLLSDVAGPALRTLSTINCED